MAKPRKTSRKSTPERAHRARPDVTETAEKIGKARLARQTAEQRERAERAVFEVQRHGLDRPEVERLVHEVLDTPIHKFGVEGTEEFGEGAREARGEYEAAVGARLARIRAGELSFAEQRRPIDPRRFESRDTSHFAASKQRADEAARADYVYREPEAPMYVPGGEEILGAPESVDLARYRKPLTEEQRAAAEASAGAVPGLSEEVGATIDERLVNKFLRTHTESEVDALLDSARRFTNAFRESRGKDALPLNGDFSDEEVAYAILRTGPARKAVAGRFTAAARGKLDPETGEVLHEGVAARYAMQPALSGALKSAYKSAKRAKMDPTARNLAAAAQAWHLLMKLRGAHKRFDATVRHYLAASKSKREGYGYGRLRLDIFLLAKEHGFAVPPEMGKWPSAKLLHERWIESARERG